MALVLKDRVKETSTSTGTGSFVLAGAVDGYQSFTAALADGDTTWYGIEDGTDWEVGLGTWTESTATLARTTVYSSSNSDSAVDWGAGSKNVFMTLPASRVHNSVEVYATTDDIPSTGSTGDMAFVTATGRLLVYASSQWFSVVMANATPVISGNDASYQLATDGTATVITLTSVDPEGADITWSYTTSGLNSEATISQNVNQFTITPSTTVGNAGSFSITFRASDGVNLGTSTSVFKLDFLTPLYFPNANEGFYVDFTDTANMYTDTAATEQVSTTGDNVSAVRQIVDLGGSASYLISDLVGDADGSYTSELPTLGNDGTRYFAAITQDAAFRTPTVVGDLQNCIFCMSAKNISYSDSNSRMFTMESPSITGRLQIGIEGASGQLFCRLSGTATTFTVDSTNGITLNSSTPSLITVVIQSGVATFRENGVDLGNSGSGGPTANSSIGCVLGGGYEDAAYNTGHDTYGALFAYGTFSSTDIDTIEATIAGLAGITL